jgi:hypothetical protein
MGANKSVFTSLMLLGFLVLVLQLNHATAGNGIDANNSSGIGETDSISAGSTVENIADAFDNSESSYARMLADGETNTGLSNCASQSTTAYSQITYTIQFQSKVNSTLLVDLYSETTDKGVEGWSNVIDLEMSAIITDAGGTWTAWQSSTPDNSDNPSPTTVNLGQMTPRMNSTVEVILRIQHDGVWEGSCNAELWIYDFSTDSIPQPIISYPESSYTVTQGIEISPIIPVNTGSAAADWEVTSGNLPEGLSLSPVDGSITGTPTNIGGPSSVTIGAANSGGTDYATISISVIDIMPEISYPENPITLTNNVALTGINPVNNGGTATSWNVISGNLPAGLSLNSSSGEIIGIPTQLVASSSITIRATNSGGSSTTSIQISVVNQHPFFSYPNPTYTFTKSSFISPIYPILSGGTVDNWSIASGMLPNGLTLGSADGVISGNPTELVSDVALTIKATNSQGSINTTITLTVSDVPPSISYPHNTYQIETGTEIITISPKNDGGTSNNWAVIAGGLPEGLTLNTQNGQITGTPTTEYINSQVRIQANNSGGTDTFDLLLQVSPTANIDTMDGQYDWVFFSLIIILFLVFGIGWIRRGLRKGELGDTY